MATLKFNTVALMLSIVFWGTLLGGIAYSHLVYFPVYLSDLPNSAALVHGPYALNEGRFWMTIHPLLLLSLLAALILNWRVKSRRKLIAISFVAYIVVLAVSALYFIPELFAFARSPQSGVAAAEWAARAHRWEILSWLRGSVCYAFFVPLLLALTKPADPQVQD
ncbi:MAG TPA: hypothetical protein VH394_01555 [Thermoanaerobaculia bacterium]|jgi:uncharacterized membrane protein|nr:hypothetical protein [Thermoanaerobaculia bacterium]